MREKIEEQNQKSSMVVHPGFWGTVADIAIMAVIALVAFICIIPLWHVVMCSVSDGFTLLSHEGMAWKPVGGFTLNGYKLLFQDSSIISGYINTDYLCNWWNTPRTGDEYFCRLHFKPCNKATQFYDPVLRLHNHV